MASSKVKIVGPLAPYAERFGCALFDLGYTDLSAADQFRLMGHLSRWMVTPALRRMPSAITRCRGIAGIGRRRVTRPA